MARAFLYFLMGKRLREYLKMIQLFRGLRFLKGKRAQRKRKF